MTAAASDTIDICVEIRFERPLSLGVVPAGEVFPAYPGDERLVWLPRAEIKAIRLEPNNRATLTLPHWLAEAERLISATDDNAAQGRLL